MIRSVARHCEPPNNWTLLRGDEPHLLNGPVPSRIISTAVFHKEVFDSEGTESSASGSSKSAAGSAERRQMFEATRSSAVTAQPRHDWHQTSPQKSSNPRLYQSNTKPGNREAEAVPSRGITTLEKKSAKLPPVTGTYCLTYKDIQMLSAVSGCPAFKRCTHSPVGRRTNLNHRQFLLNVQGVGLIG